MDKDPVARAIAGAEIDALGRLTKHDQFSLTIGSANLRLIARLMTGSYKQKLEDALVSGFANPNRRVEFRRTCGFYASHLINLGYSQTHIAAEVEKVFFSRPIVRVGAATLRRFFRRFTGREKRFVVYAGLTDEFARFLQRLGFTMHDRSRLPAEVSTTIDANSNADRLGLVLRYSLDAFDDYGALLAVESILGSIRALTYLAPQGMHCEWAPKST